MRQKLLELWFNDKEIKLFLYLVEFWISPASEIARNILFPKSTVNFLADNLWKKWILKKSFRWKTGYYEADIFSFEKNLLQELENKKNILEKIIPELKEKNKNTFDRPKVFLFFSFNSGIIFSKIFFLFSNSCNKFFSKLLISAS